MLLLALLATDGGDVAAHHFEGGAVAAVHFDQSLEAIHGSLGRGDELGLHAGSLTLLEQDVHAFATRHLLEREERVIGFNDLGDFPREGFVDAPSAGEVLRILRIKTGRVDGDVVATGGIESTVAAADTTYLTAIGVIQNATNAGMRLYSTFDGHPVAATDVLLKYTYVGDANLDGKVDGSDYSLIDNAFIYNETHTTAPLTGWYNGDFNYDGVTDGSDYTLIDNAFNTQGASLATAVAESATTTAQIAGSGTAAVPEPATLGLMGFAAVGLLCRRMNHRRAV